MKEPIWFLRIIFPNFSEHQEKMENNMLLKRNEALSSYTGGTWCSRIGKMA